MKFHDINRKYTNKVVEYIAQGYTMNTESMSGTQGEIAKIDLVKDNELIRIWLETDHSSYWNADGDTPKWRGDMVLLRVGKWIYPADVAKSRTVWFREFDIMENEIFYKISRSYDRSGWYTDDLDEAIAILAVRQERYKHVTYDEVENVTSEATIEIAKKYMKRKHGYTRVSADKIVVRKYKSLNKKNTGYRICYNGVDYKLA